MASQNLTMCYYTNWAQMRASPANMLPEDIDVNLCSHVIFIWQKVLDGERVPYGVNLDDPEIVQSIFSRMLKLKEKNPQLKLLIHIPSLSHFDEISHDLKTRKRFLKDMVDLLTRTEFDGFSELFFCLFIEINKNKN